MFLWKQISLIFSRLFQFSYLIMFRRIMRNRITSYNVCYTKLLRPGLRSYSEYNREPAKSKKYRNGCSLNAVVVTIWRGMQIAAGKEKVLLTSLAGNTAVEIMQKYRLRSFIENCCFRELKQAAFLSCLPKRKGNGTENSAYIHIALCVISHTIFYAFIYWRRKRRRTKAQIKTDPNHLREFRKQTRIKSNAIFVLYKRFV